MPAQQGIGLDQMEGVAPRGVQTGQYHQDKPVLMVEARARWRRSSEHEDLLAEERVLGHKLRAGPDGINADSAHECCRRAGGSQQVLDDSATSAGAATDGNLHGVGQPFQHAGLLLHRDWAPGGSGFTVQSVDAVSPEVETLIVRLDEVSSQDGSKVIHE